MSALIDLSARVGELADRLDLSTGPGAAALRKHYIEPSMQALDKVVTKSFGTNRQPFKGKAYKASVDYVIQAGPKTTIVFRLSPKGFWVFGQYGSKPHMIPVNKMKRIRAAGDHPTRGPVKHPGSKGKRAIDGAWRAIRHNQHEQIAAAIDELMTDG